ncbi:MAG: rhodanese-like domain-containing protein [Gammaproteobacteria bacterium]|jgi:rhodanese-related sulfurtransferase
MQEQLMQFIIHHWFLWLAFAIVIILVILEEMRSKFNAVPAISAQELTMLLNHEEATLIDIRSRELFQKEHILNAQNIPISGNDIAELQNKLQSKKDQALVLVDSIGSNATTVATKLRTQGFLKIKILEGGMSAWKKAELPTTNR